jgi:Flp pilus assembly protein TadG
MSARRAAGRRAHERGQSLVEFTLILPVFLLVLLGMLEYGSAYDHRTAMAYAVREGARVGASLGNGGSSPGTVDPAIVAAVQRGLTNPILIDNITSIDIYKADPTTGLPMTGKMDSYDKNGSLVGTAGWPATDRVVGLNGDSIGVRVRYDFHPITPLGTFMGLIFSPIPGYSTIPMADSSVMHLEPIP